MSETHRHIAHLSNGVTGTDDVDMWEHIATGNKEFVTNGSDYESLTKMMRRFDASKRALITEEVLRLLPPLIINPLR